MVGGNSGAGLPVQPRLIKRSGGGGCLVWGLVGCGVLMIAAAAGLFIAVRGPLRGVLNGGSEAQNCSNQMETVQTALSQYQNDHDGKLPAKLQALVPKYLADAAELTCGKEAGSAAPRKVEYTPPGPESPPDAPVISLKISRQTILGQQTTTVYLRALKDGSLVYDQVIRMPLSDLAGARRRRSGR